MSTTPAASTTPAGGSSARLAYHALIWLAVAGFSTGIDGYVLAGLLPAIATDLQVSAALAGQLLSVFALTAAFAGPVLGALTSGWERRRTISWALAVFVLGNLVVALAPTYAVAVTGRFISAIGGSLLGAAISSYVIHLAPPEQRGRALSFVLGGWMAATALGVPVGLVLGQTNWRFPLVMVALVGTIALVGILAKLPHLRLPATTLAERLEPLRRPRVVVTLLVTWGILSSSYACFTFAALILRPYFPQGWAMILIMFGYGAASMLGNAVTGRLADRFTPVRVLGFVLTGLLINAVFGAVVFAVGGRWGASLLLGIAGLVWFFVCGIGNGGAAVPQQARLAAMAPLAAPVIMALNASAISLGNASGGGLAGLALTLGWGPEHLPILSAVILMGTLAVHLLVSRWRDSVGGRDYSDRHYSGRLTARRPV